MDANNYKFQLTAIQCADCGAVVSVLEAYNLTHLLGRIAAHVGLKLE